MYESLDGHLRVPVFFGAVFGPRQLLVITEFQQVLPLGKIAVIVGYKCNHITRCKNDYSFIAFTRQLAERG